MRSRATLGARLASAVTTVAAVVLASVLAQQVPGVDAAALTTQVKPHERSCFYAWVDKVGEKVGFYYAVQAGGSFDVDYDVVSPSDKHIISGEKERQVDIVFTGNEVGEYSFCFENDMSSFADKTVRVWKGGVGGRKGGGYGGWGGHDADMARPRAWPAHRSTLTSPWSRSHGWSCPCRKQRCSRRSRCRSRSPSAKSTRSSRKYHVCNATSAPGRTEASPWCTGHSAYDCDPKHRRRRIA